MSKSAKLWLLFAAEAVASYGQQPGKSLALLFRWWSIECVLFKCICIRVVQTFHPAIPARRQIRILRSGSPLEKILQAGGCAGTA